MDAAIESAWERVLADWEDAQAHKAFLTLCASTDRLGDAGRRYRAERERDPSRREVADAQIERVLGLAMERLATQKTVHAPRSANKKLLLVAVGVSGAMIASAVFALLRMF